MQNGGIFGTTLSGKTTLAKRLVAEYWQRFKLRSIVLCPFNDDWGGSALVIDDDQTFWRTVWSAKDCLVVVDEASATVNRDKTLKPVFTRLRHHGHKLLVIGHSSADLLPVMRQSLDTLYLFRHPPKSAAVWAETFTETDLMRATELGQFEFLYCRLYHKPVRSRLQIIQNKV